VAEQSKIQKISLRASVIAGVILILLAWAGTPLLKHVFHVDIYSLQIVGGLILLYRGFLALNHGLFFESDLNQRLEDASIVPLASPMIAGPATITAAVSFPGRYGMTNTLLAIACAVFINFLVMIGTRFFAAHLKRYNLMGALIRITGLIVATIGVQMMLDGLLQYIKLVQAG
jgi:multiple antibiotic resistance protein